VVLNISATVALLGVFHNKATLKIEVNIVLKVTNRHIQKLV